MAFLGTLSEVNASVEPDVPSPQGMPHTLAAQATTGTGPRSLCQAHTAARAAATSATLPHTAAAISASFGWCTGTARRNTLSSVLFVRCRVLVQCVDNTAPLQRFWLSKGKSGAPPALSHRMLQFLQ